MISSVGSPVDLGRVTRRLRNHDDFFIFWQPFHHQMTGRSEEFETKSLTFVPVPSLFLVSCSRTWVQLHFWRTGHSDQENQK